MNQQIAKQWVEALRSGKYEQGKLYLNKDNKFCCLGVLCEILNVPKVEYECGPTYYDGSLNVLPGKTMDQTGIKYDNGSISKFDIILSKLNDDGTPFNEIADIIEKYWEEL